jgi:uncharacterized protein
MKNSILIFAFLCLPLLSIAQLNADVISIGEIDSIQSSILNEKRKIWVHVPKSFADDAKKRYPVVYLLDGDAHFYSVVGMSHQLSSVNGNKICPEMIVVGIPNTNRTRDLTPTHVDVDMPYMDSTSCKPSGGGEDFIRFIEKELMPYIEAQYPTKPYKMLVGHSFGGLLAMQTFVHHNHLFDAYVCIDPSMWWDSQKLLKESQKALANRNFNGKTLYLGIANTLDKGMTINKVMYDKSPDSKHIRSILALKTAFEKNKQNGLQFKGKYYPNDSHVSVPLITEYDALHFIFKNWQKKMI